MKLSIRAFKEESVGRRVKYTETHPGAVPEFGIVTSYNREYVFVVYEGKNYSQATRPCDLEWAVKGDSDGGDTSDH